MKLLKTIALAAGILAAGSLNSNAQTNIVTVTNVVTVLVTNIVTVTNIVSSEPAPAPAVVPATNPAVAETTPKYPWKSSISAGLALTRGNSHSLLYNGDIETAKKTPNNEYSLGAGGAYGSQNGKENDNNYHAFGQWNHLFSERLYDYVRAEAKRDLIADLDYRINIGPGIGYYWVKGTNTTLSTEAGAGYQNEHLGGAYNSFATLRLAEQFEHKFTDRARLWQKCEWLPQVDELDNYVINFEIGIETSITKSISFKNSFVDSYATQPAPGRYKNDAKFISAISYKF
jgi:putative salt-induced outer membrane protein